MAGPVGRVSSSAPRRGRGRVWPLVLAGLLVALVAGEVIDQVVNSSEPAARQSGRSWVAAVAPIVDQENALAPTLTEVRVHGTGLARTTMDALLGQLTEGTAQASQELAELALGPATPAAGAALAGVVEGRARGCARLAGAISLATTAGSSPAQVAAALEAAAGQLRDADAQYRRFRAALPRRVGGSRLPTSRWLTRPAFWSDPNLAHWAASLQATKGLAGHAALSLVAVSLEPRALQIQGLPTTTTTAPPPTTSSTTTTSTTTTTPAGSSSSTTTSTTTTTTTSTSTTTTTTLQLPPAGSVSVLQPTTKVTVVAVVASTGNLAVRGVRLRATLTPLPGTGTDGGGAGGSATRTLGSLVPGTARYVRLPRLAVRAGASYRLQVTASSSGGASVTETVRIAIHK